MPSIDPPVAADFGFSVHMGATVAGIDLGRSTPGMGDGLHGWVVSGPSHGSIASNPSDGTYTYTADTPYAGPDSFTYQESLNDEQTRTTYYSNVATVSVNVTDHAPTAGGMSINIPSNTTASGLDLVGSGTDPDGDPILSAAISQGPQHGSVTQDGGTYSYTPTSGFAGSDSFSYTVSDGALSSAAVTVPITVTPVVHLAAPGDQLNLNHDTVNLGLSATDTAGSNNLSYSATNLPDGLTLDTNTGVIAGTISNTADAKSPYAVTVTATDKDYSAATESQAFSWVVSPHIITVAQGDQYDVAGDDVNVGVLSWSTDSHPLTFSATGLPSGLSIDSNTGSISGTLPKGADAGSPYSVTVTATDTTVGVSSDVVFNWNVAAPAVEMEDLGEIDMYVGSAAGIPTIATDNDGGKLTYTATGLPAGLTIDSNSGDISGTIDGGDETDNPYSVTVTAFDAKGSVSATSTLSFVLASPGTPPPAPSRAQQNVDRLQAEMAALSAQGVQLVMQRQQAFDNLNIYEPACLKATLNYITAPSIASRLAWGAALAQAQGILRANMAEADRLLNEMVINTRNVLRVQSDLNFWQYMIDRGAGGI